MPACAASLCDVQRVGATEDRLQGIAAEGLGEMDVRDAGRRAHGLMVEFSEACAVRASRAVGVRTARRPPFLGALTGWNGRSTCVPWARVQGAGFDTKSNVGTRLGSLNAVMRAMRVPIRVRTWMP